MDPLHPDHYYSITTTKLFVPAVTKKGDYGMCVGCVNSMLFCAENVNPSKIAYSHILSWIFKALGPKDIGEGAHMQPQQKLSQRSSRGHLRSRPQMVKIMHNLSLYSHTLMDFHWTLIDTCDTNYFLDDNYQLYR